MTRKRRFLFLLSVPFVTAALTVGARSTWDQWVEGIPVLECPHTIDLGERDRGEVALGRFWVRNGGRGPLVLNEFQTSCSCAGVEREVNGKLVRLESLQLVHGEEVELVVRVGVGARPGQSQLVQVFFKTNDPARPAGNIHAIVRRVKGGVYAEPAAVVFGTLPLRTEARQLINLYDTGLRSRRIDKVRSTHPERFDARLVPLRTDELRKVHETAGQLFARLEVTPRSEQHGPLDGYIEVSLANEGRRADLIPVSGEVVRPVECWPTTLLFPRRVGNRFVYSAEVLLSHRDGKPITVQVQSLPEGVSGSVRPVAQRADQRLLQVDCDPAGNDKFRPPWQSHMRLRVRWDGEEERLELPVLFSENPS